MNFAISISGFVALYIFMLAAFAGWVIIGHVPAILHTPLMSGSNFVHGIVVVGGIFALLNASTRARAGDRIFRGAARRRERRRRLSRSPTACSRCSSRADRAANAATPRPDPSPKKG